MGPQVDRSAASPTLRQVSPERALVQELLKSTQRIFAKISVDVLATLTEAGFVKIFNDNLRELATLLKDAPSPAVHHHISSQILPTEPPSIYLPNVRAAYQRILESLTFSLSALRSLKSSWAGLLSKRKRAKNHPARMISNGAGRTASKAPGSTNGSCREVSYKVLRKRLRGADFHEQARKSFFAE